MAVQALVAGAMVTKGLLDAYSQYSAYKDKKYATMYNQAIIDANTMIDNSLIDLNQRRIQDEGEELLGAQRAAIGKSGTKFSGSNLDVFMDTLKDIEMDIIGLDIQKSINTMQAEQEKGLLARDLRSTHKALPMKYLSTAISTGTSIAGSQSGNIAQSLA